MAEYQVLYWRNIPAQVRVYEGKRPLSRELPENFQKKAKSTMQMDTYPPHRIHNMILQKMVSSKS